MREGIAVLLIVSLSAVAAPTTAMASEEIPEDVPRLVITVVCTIYSDHLDETITGMDLALGVNLGQYMPDCEMTTEYVEAVQAPSVTVDMPEGALFPACAEANDCFVPHTVTVGAGTDVTWTNSDTVLHTVTEPGGLFDSWLLPGEEFTFTFETPGTYAYGCTVHPWASGAVVVESQQGAMPAEEEAPEPAAEEVTPSMEVVGLLDDFVDMYRSSGDASFAAINEMSDPDSEIVGWIISPVPEYRIVAHNSNPPFVGFPVGPLLAQANIPIDQLAQAIEDLGMPVQVSYPLPGDPLGNIFVYEKAWVTEHDGYFFAARPAVSAESRVQDIVDYMILQYSQNPSATLDRINSFMSPSPNYPFVLDPETKTIVAHGQRADRVGNTSVVLTNSSVPFETLDSMEEGAANGVWSTYTFYNPATDTEDSKVSWIVKHDGLLFGSGYYP